MADALVPDMGKVAESNVKLTTDANRRGDRSLVSSRESGYGVMGIVAMDRWDGKTGRAEPSHTREFHEQKNAESQE